MNLTFLRRNSAFNLKEGNNAAYFICKDELFLIDCGKLVFAKLLNTTNLRIFGCPSNTYNLINEKDFDNKYNSFKEIIPNYLKDKTYCMHLNNSTLITEGKAINFNVVKVPPTLKRQKNKNILKLSIFHLSKN